PDPDKRILLDHRVVADLGALGDLVLAGDAHAAPRLVEYQPVIAAFEAELGDLADVERRAAMAAAILERPDLAVLAAEQHDRLVHDPAPERLVADLVAPSGDIPSVTNEHRFLLGPLGP